MSSLGIRPAAARDRGVIRDVVTTAFADHGLVVADLVDALHDAGHALVSLVAELDGEVVGHVQLNRSWVDARERLVEVLVLSPLSVRPDRQGQGIGSALVASALDAAEGRAAPAVFLEGDPAYYGRRGFSPGAEHGFARPSRRIPEPAFQAAVLSAHEVWMTGALVYCEPFWAHDCVGLRDPRLSEVEATFGRVAPSGSDAPSR